MKMFKKGMSVEETINFVEGCAVLNCFFAHAGLLSEAEVQSGCQNIIHSGETNPLTWKIYQK